MVTKLKDVKDTVNCISFGGKSYNKSVLKLGSLKFFKEQLIEFSPEILFIWDSWENAYTKLTGNGINQINSQPNIIVEKKAKRKAYNH